MAADYEPPSFSLGLDFDLGFESELQTAPPSPPHVPVDEIGSGLDPDIRAQSPRPLKRLKRGLPEKPPPLPFAALKMRSKSSHLRNTLFKMCIGQHNTRRPVVVLKSHCVQVEF